MTDIAELDAEPLDETVEPAEVRLRALARLTEIGMSLAELAHRRALAEAEKPSDEASSKPAWDFGLAFAKIARGVRLTVFLEEKLEAALRDRKSGLQAARRARALKSAEVEAARIAAVEKAELDAAEAERREAWQAANAPRLAREAAVDQVMDALIHRQHRRNEDQIERLEREFEDLVGDYGDYDDYGHRPVSKTVSALCEEMDLEPEWERWGKSAWAIEEAETGVEGSPYVSVERGGTGECVRGVQEVGLAPRETGPP